LRANGGVGIAEERRAECRRFGVRARGQERGYGAAVFGELALGEASEGRHRIGGFCAGHRDEERVAIGTGGELELVIEALDGLGRGDARKDAAERGEHGGAIRLLARRELREEGFARFRSTRARESERGVETKLRIGLGEERHEDVVADVGRRCSTPRTPSASPRCEGRDLSPGEADDGAAARGAPVRPGACGPARSTVARRGSPNPATNASDDATIRLPIGRSAGSGRFTALLAGQDRAQLEHDGTAFDRR
jgi:hypothetical protein